VRPPPAPTAATWTSTLDPQANPYRVAVHPFDGTKAVVAARTGLPLTFTRDAGQTWGNSSGGVASVGQQGNFWFGQPLAVDQQVRELSRGPVTVC
jgi:hypothetical protein